jgi:adenine deaminase
LIISPRTNRAIAPKTLREAFRDELDRGMALADYAVANALFTNATVNNNVTAQIWWTKARMGWKETQQQQFLDQDGKPTSPGFIVNIAQYAEPDAPPKANGGARDARH